MGGGGKENQLFCTTLFDARRTSSRAHRNIASQRGEFPAPHMLSLSPFIVVSMVLSFLCA